MAGTRNTAARQNTASPSASPRAWAQLSHHSRRHVATASPGPWTFPITKRLLAGSLVVDDDEVRRAMRAAFETLKLVVEPGGAAPLAAVLAGKLEVAGKTIVLVLSGGNVDHDVFVSALA